MVAPAAGFAIASAGISAIGKLLGGIGANQAAKARARTLEMGARMDLDETGAMVSAGLEEDERVAARLAVEAAAGGGGGLGGSALAVLNDLGRQSLMKARNTVYQGQTAAWAKRSDAAQARAQGRMDLMSGVLGAGGSLLGGFAKAYATGG